MDGEIEAFDARWRCVSVAAANRLEPLRLHQNGVSEVETWSEHAKKGQCLFSLPPWHCFILRIWPRNKSSIAKVKNPNGIEWHPWQIYFDKYKMFVTFIVAKW